MTTRYLRDSTQTESFGPFDRMYERVGADKAYYMACAFTVSTDVAEFWAALKMLRAVGQLELYSFIGGCLFPENDSAGMSEAQYDAWREQAWGFRDYLEQHPGLMGWHKQL